MQLIVLGMHRSGTSAVSRLLNMMGAYFCPPDQALPPAKDNPKGFWERKDVVRLHEQVFSQLNMSWDNLSQFSQDSLTDEIAQLFVPQAQSILCGLDARRPWFIKDPRLCLLLPLWKPLLEIPLCVYVYRSPLQIARSLAKVRSDFSVSLGVALWEKYTVHALDNSHDMPRVFVAHEALLKNPFATVEKLYQDLQAQEVQGLRMPTRREIEAFIDPNLFHQRTEDQQDGFINQRQLALHQAVVQGTIDTQTCYVEQLSASTQEQLAAYREKLIYLQQTQDRIHRLESEVAQKTQVIAHHKVCHQNAITYQRASFASPKRVG